jgi:hypothetical protein
MVYVDRREAVEVEGETAIDLYLALGLWLALLQLRSQSPEIVARTIEGATEWTGQPNGLNPIKKLYTILNPRLLQRI